AKRPPNDFYYWHAATLALRQVDARGDAFKKWTAAVAEALVSHQKTEKNGCREGSWDTEGVDRWAYAGGRVYGTAMNVLTLEVYYRYASVFGSDKRGGEGGGGGE